MQAEYALGYREDKPHNARSHPGRSQTNRMARYYFLCLFAFTFAVSEAGVLRQEPAEPRRTNHYRTEYGVGDQGYDYLGESVAPNQEFFVRHRSKTRADIVIVV